jgi:CRISPR type III-B/RAMP module-associated protein Cmr3
MKPDNTDTGRWLRLGGLDTLFFRGAERFDAAAGGGAYLSSLFPPNPGTVFSAFNSILLKDRALPSATEQDHDYEDGARSRAGHQLSRGPWLYCGEKDRGSLLLPAPAALLAEKEESGQNPPPPRLHRLHPGSARYRTDLSPDDDTEGRGVQLPLAPDAPKGLKALENAWLSREGYQGWLAGNIPAPHQWLRAKDLWCIERHTGLERDGANRVAKEGMLYSAAHIRLRKGVGLLINLPEASSEAIRQLPRHMPLGGEGRAVWIDVLSERLTLPAMPRLAPVGDKLYYTLSLITPGLGAKWGVMPNAAVQDGVPGHIICCALGRSVRIGAFDTARNQPERIRSARAAGSVWWMEAKASQADAIRKLHNTCIGAGANQGYGNVVVGVWPR